MSGCGAINVVTDECVEVIRFCGFETPLWISALSGLAVDGSKQTDVDKC